MRAVTFSDGAVSVRDMPAPPVAPGEARVRVLRAGICATDLALRRGYLGFSGVPGHEFVGLALDGPLAGERVVGEINAACRRCEACRAGLDRHCPHRTVLGIVGRAGAFAEEIALPVENLYRVPENVSLDAAVFAEPLAAAFAVTEQVELPPGASTLVAGDGRLGLLCAHVLHLAGLRTTIAGRHPERRSLLPPGVEHRTGMLERDTAWYESPPAERFDLAVDATGRGEVLGRLIPWVRPRGTLVLKTTSEAAVPLDTSPIVVNELRVLGSRCGRFAPALRALAEGTVPVERLIHARYPLSHAETAFAHAARPGTLKILFDLDT